MGGDPVHLRARTSTSVGESAMDAGRPGSVRAKYVRYCKREAITEWKATARSMRSAVSSRRFSI